MELQSFIQKFISYARESEQITIYNKASLLHELALFLEQHLQMGDYDVQISRQAEQVVMGAKGEDFTKEVIDLYVYQITGKEQYAIQLYVMDGEENSPAVAAPKDELYFLKSLKHHGFRQAHLLLIRSEKVDEAEIVLPKTYSVEWQELQRLSQGGNGLWVCAVLTV
ncbi:hypothetical protein [Pontibacter beigongshangensis]|uniref:hypothetical protein n=1 Tax=Pontibacter beigongshangensis TaxID=2574733 RepID=UPI0016505882|nr:hypothetical protein [Pontibacter beigongshangensis]